MIQRVQDHPYFKIVNLDFNELHLPQAPPFESSRKRSACGLGALPAAVDAVRNVGAALLVPAVSVQTPSAIGTRACRVCWWSVAQIRPPGRVPAPSGCGAFRDESAGALGHDGQSFYPRLAVLFTDSRVAEHSPTVSRSAFAWRKSMRLSSSISERSTFGGAQMSDRSEAASA